MRVLLLPLLALLVTLSCSGSDFASAQPDASTTGGSAGADAGSAGADAAGDGAAGGAGADGASEEAASCDCNNDGTCEDLKTDPSHCGDCWHNCIGAQCSDGQCLPLQFAVGVDEADLLGTYAWDDNHDNMYVVWYSADKHFLQRKAGAQGGTDPVPLVSADQAGGFAVARANDVMRFYWTSTADGRVMVCDLAETGCANEKEYATGQNQPRLIVGDDAGVYWVNDGTGILFKGAGSQALHEEMLTITPPPTALALDADSVYWISGGTAYTLQRPDSKTPLPRGGMCTDGIGLAVGPSGDFYCTGAHNGTVGKFGSVGYVGEITGQYEPGGIVVFGEWVYWQNNFQPYAIRRLRAQDFPPPGTEPSAEPQDYVPSSGGYAMAASKFNVFFIDQNSNLMRLVM
jgi:hypothetical protein